MEMKRSSSLLERARVSRGMLGIFLGLVIFANIIAVYYVTREHYVYFWDSAIYWLKYLDLSASFLRDSGSAVRALVQSIRHEDYNLLPTLPLLPFSWLFGGSRLAYILAVTNVALVPAALVLAHLARRISQEEAGSASLSSLVVAITSILLVHALWAPVLRGYPDVIGVLVIGIILSVHFAKPLAEQRPIRLIVTGLLLCLLVFLRRYYAFWAVAFFPALMVAQCVAIMQRDNHLWSQFVTIIRNAVIIGLTFTVALFVLAAPLMFRILQTDYADIYSAYKFSHSLLDSATQLLGYFGWPILVCGFSGLLYLVLRKETRVVGTFLIIQLIIISALFTRTQDFGQQHYYLLLPAIALGIAVAAMTVWTRFTTPFVRGAAVGILLIALFSSFTAFIPGASKASQRLGGLIPQFQAYPLVRYDVPELGRLLDTLEELQRNQPGEIYVLASSVVLNSSIMQNACRQIPPERTACNQILPTNDVDKRDGFPQQFLRAQYLVVASPTQYHLRAEDQRVVGVLAREVMEGDGLANSYERLPYEFKLDENATVWILTKIRPLQRTDLDALEKEFAGYYPGMRVSE